MTHTAPRLLGSLAQTLGALLFVTVVIAGCGSTEEIDPAPRRAPFQVDVNWPHLPEGTILGQVSGVGIDSKGNPILFRRAERDWFGEPLSTTPINVTTVMRVDAATGALISEMCANLFAMPHGLFVDANDHLWVTDVALNQVFELDPQGNVLRSFGERGVSGNDSTHFFMPTDVVVAKDGSFFVSDGYGNSRVVKFDKEGVFVRSWGEPGSLPGQFSVPHGIAIGPDDNVYVADRGNARVQIFDQSGVLLGSWQSEALGRPWSIAFDDSGHAFVADGGDQKLPNRSRVLEVDSTGNIITSFGSYGPDKGQMIEPHDLAVGHDGSVYVVEVGTGRRAQKFIPDRTIGRAM